MEFKLPSKGKLISPTGKGPAWRQFLASNGGVVLMWILVILCILAAMRMHSPDEDDSQASQQKIFAPEGENKDEVVPVNPAAQDKYGGSSLDSAPRWGALTPMDDEGGPIEDKKEQTAAAPPGAPPAGDGQPQAPGAGQGIGLPNTQQAAEQIAKKMLGKPTGKAAEGGAGGASGGASQFVSLDQREKREKEAADRARQGEGGPALGGSARSAVQIPSVGRGKMAVVQTGGGTGEQKLAVEKEILYKIDSLVKTATERAQEGGGPAAITDKEARDLMHEIGVKMGSRDKATSPNSVGTDR